jgi:hypothetical protein
MKRGLASAFLLGACLAPAIARAQPAASAVAAEELFRQGRQLLEEKRYDEACPKLEASQKLDPAVGTQFSLGDCYRGESRLASAWFAYRGAAGVAAQKDDPRRARAQKSADAIEPHLAHLLVHLSPGQGPIEVSIDGNRIVPEVLTNPFPVDPGEHHVEAKGRTLWNQVVDVPSNDVKVDVAIPLIETAEEGAIEEARRRSNATKRTVGLVVLGTGAAVAVAGGVLGMQAIIKGRDVNGECPGTGNTCSNQGAVNENSTARTFATISSVLLPVGLAAVAAGSVVLLTAHGSVEASVTPKTASVALGWKF